MNVVLYGRPQAAYTAEELDRLFNALESNGMRCRINGDFASQVASLTGRTFAPEAVYDERTEVGEGAHVMLSYGGDGTFLDCVRLLGGRPVPIAGINSGRLGFLADVSREHLESALSDIAKGNFTTSPRTLLHVRGDFCEPPRYPYAFNELAVQRQGANMISTEVYVDGEMIAAYWGDGVLVSTPAGSTAYSLSVGGPVVAPDCRCFLISPIAPHNLTMRPVVIPDTGEVTFRVTTREAGFSVSLDNRSYAACNGAAFRVSKSPDPIFLVRLQNISFYDTLRKKMMWGIDSRPVR